MGYFWGWGRFTKRSQEDLRGYQPDAGAEFELLSFFWVAFKDPDWEGNDSIISDI